MKTTDLNALLNKTFVIYNIDDTILEKFVIKYAKQEILPEIYHRDGSYTAERQEIWVSDAGNGWYKYYGNRQGMILNLETQQT